METFDQRHAVAFGGFQAVMPLLGWLLAGRSARSIGRAAALIGVCACPLGLVGVLVGHRVGARLGVPVEIAGASFSS